MAGVFDSQYLLKSLRELTESKNQIEDISKWCQENVGNAKEIVRMWNTEYTLSRDRRVAFLYLVNHILHRSIESNRVFADEFAEVLPGAIDRELEYLKKSEEIVPQMISIWREKQFYGPEFLMGHIDDSGSRGEKRKRVSEEEEKYIIDSVSEEEEEYTKKYTIDSVLEEEEEYTKKYTIDSVSEEEEEYSKKYFIDSDSEEYSKKYTIDSVSEEEEEEYFKKYTINLASNKAAELKTLMVESVDSISNIQSQVTTLTAEVEQLRKKFKEAENLCRKLSG